MRGARERVVLTRGGSDANDRTPLDFFDDNAMAYYLEHASQDSMLSSSPMATPSLRLPVPVYHRPEPIMVPASPAAPLADFSPGHLEFVSSEAHSRLADELSECRTQLHHAKQRISELEADGECIICFEHRIDSVILECAHAVLCFQCASQSRNCTPTNQVPPLSCVR